MNKIIFSLILSMVFMFPNISFAVDPFLQAIMANEFDTAKLDKLLQEGGKVNAKEETNGYTPLIIAVNIQKIDLIKFLLEKGADPNIADNAGISPLMYASLYKNKDILTALVLAKADINAKNKEQRTALMHAVAVNDLDAVKYLLENGADINAREAYGETALYQAVGFGYSSLCSELIKQGADINLAATNGFTPLMRAVYNKPASLVKSLMENGMNNSDVLPPNTTIEQVAQKNPDKVNVLALFGIVAKGEIPQHYELDPGLASNAKAALREFYGEDLVDVLFLESKLRPFKNSKYPYNITHYSMKVGIIHKANGKTLMSTQDMQIFGDGSQTKHYRFLVPMSGGKPKVEVEYP